MKARDPLTKSKLANSPLILALAEIRFSPVLVMEHYIPAIQETLRRGGFPGFMPATTQQIQFIGDSGPTMQTSTRWLFTSIDGSDVVTLSTESLSFHTRNYDDFETFMQSLQRVIDAVAVSAEPSFVQRVGLRYVDAIPAMGEDLSNYFNESIRSFTAADLGVKSLLLNQQIVADTDHGHLLIRMSQVKDGPLLPFDLNALEFAELTIPRDGVHAILDIDSSDERRGEFSFETLEERLWGVHSVASTAFWKSITDRAAAEWGKSVGKV
jgi:uncharacterized protein (TIGR04255 family)